MLGTSGYAAVSFITRTQKTGGDFNISSNLLSASYPILNQSTGRPWSGVGITMMDDRSGGIFRTQEASLSYAVNIRLTRYEILSIGFKGLLQSRSISLDGLNTSQQYIPDRGFSASAFNGETLSEFRNSYSTFSTGVYWQQTDRKEKIIAHWGLSLFDINKPKDPFIGTNSQLSSTLVFHGGLQVYQKNELSIFPEVLYTGNFANHLFNMGLRFQYQMKSMPNQATAKIDVLTKYVPGRSGIVGFQLHRENFSFGVSYDFPLFVNNAGNLGALEVGLEIRRLVDTKTRRQRSKNQKEQQKKNVAKKISPKTNSITKVMNNKMVKEDSVLFSTVNQLEVAKVDTAKIQPDAKTGTLRHEPYIVEKITLRFQFDYNSIDLDDETELFLNDLGKSLEEDRNLKVKIIGHTDNIGHEKFNEKLSLKRAESVKKFLVKNGLNEARVMVDGKGMRAPIAENDTEENRAKNRRVEILLYRED